MLWRDKFWAAVCERFDIEPSQEEGSQRQYRLVDLPPDVAAPLHTSVFKGEMGRLGSYDRQRPCVSLPLDGRTLPLTLTAAQLAATLCSCVEPTLYRDD